jgi:hypothetical protein
VPSASAIWTRGGDALVMQSDELKTLRNPALKRRRPEEGGHDTAAEQADRARDRRSDHGSDAQLRENEATSRRPCC